MDTKNAYLILNLLPGIGPLRVNQLLTLYRTPEAILQAGEKDLARVPGIGGKLAPILAHWEKHCNPDAERDRVERAGAHLITRADDEYPDLLAEIHDPPLCLYVRGSRDALESCRHGISMVGSRRTTNYGVRMAEHLATAAAYAGWPVVSGLARGIDTAAHRGVVNAGGCTIAVLGGGLGHIYPQENVALARQIVENGGALVAEFPMLCRPDKRTFPMRNRIISGLTRGTIVVEAGVKSGSLITASQALDQGRQVFAVPGRVDCPQSRGCHGLIKDGAKLVEAFEDVAEEFVHLPGMEAPDDADKGTAADDAARDPGLEGLTLSDLERNLLSFLGDNELGIDDIVHGLDATAADVLGALVMLEMRRLVRQLPGRRVARTGSAKTG